MFLHGTGTFTGFEAARVWAKSHRVVIPYHPGFGDSGDAVGLDTMEDYVLHYMDLFDRLGLKGFDLAGFSLGGWLAAEYAIRQPERLHRLVLIAPVGLVVDAAPAPDIFKIPPPELPSYLAHDVAAVLRYFPKQPDPAFEARMGREIGGLAKLIGDRAAGQSQARPLAASNPRPDARAVGRGGSPAPDRPEQGLGRRAAGRPRQDRAEDRTSGARGDAVGRRHRRRLPGPVTPANLQRRTVQDDQNADRRDGQGRGL